MCNARRLKFAENVEIIPRNRFFFNYNYFHSVPLTTSGAIGVNRFTPGFEKTFLDKQASIEVRVPYPLFDVQYSKEPESEYHFAVATDSGAPVPNGTQCDLSPP